MIDVNVAIAMWVTAGFLLVHILGVHIDKDKYD